MDNHKKYICNLLLLLFFITAKATYAATISYDIANIVGNIWEYTYTVENNSLGDDLEEFTIFFELGLYENLVATSTPAGWDPLVIEPDPLLPDDGFYDALALFVLGIAPGDTLAGIGVQFDFLGVGTPGDQFFDIVDPFTFDVLESGTTVATVASVPEPSVLCLVGFGLTFLTTRRKLSLWRLSLNSNSPFFNRWRYVSQRIWCIKERKMVTS